MANFYRSFSKYMIERWSSLKAGSSSVFTERAQRHRLKNVCMTWVDRTMWRL